MNTKKILGVVAVLALVAVAMVGAGAADASASSWSDLKTAMEAGGTVTITGNIVAGSENITVTNDVTLTAADNTSYTIDMTSNKITINGSGITVSLGKDKGIKFTGTLSDTYYNSPVTIAKASTVSNLNLDLGGTVNLTGNSYLGEFVNLSGSVTLMDSVLDFRDVTNSGEASVIGLISSATSTLDNVTLINGNSGAHKSQAILANSGSLTIQNCNVNDGISTGSSVSTRESVVIRMRGANVTVSNSVLTSNNDAVGAKNVAIAIDGTQGQNAALTLSGVTFEVGTNGYEIWNEETSDVSSVPVAFNSACTYGSDGLKIAFWDSTAAAGLYPGVITFNGSYVPATYTIDVGMSKDGAVMKASTLNNALTLAGYSNDISTVTLKNNLTDTSIDGVTVPSGAKLIVPSDVTLSTAHMTVNGTVDASAGTLKITSASTLVVIGTGQVITKSYGDLLDGSVVIKDGGELKVTGSGVTLDDVKTKIKNGTEAGAIITVNDSSYQVTTQVTTPGTVATQAVTTKGTIVTLSVSPTYTFTVPASVVLSQRTGQDYAIVTDDTFVKVASDVKYDNKKMVVKITSTGYSDEAETPKYTHFKLTGDTSSSNEAVYMVGKATKSGSSFTKNEYIEGISTGVVTNNVVVSHEIGASATELSATQYIYFETNSYSVADSYSGTLEFNFAVEDISS